LEHSNDDHITWLKEYNERKDNIANINTNKKINLDEFGIDTGLAS